MLFGLLVAVFCGTALARPGYPGYGQGRVEPQHGHHEMTESPFGGRRSSLTQGIICDTCTVTIELAQERINVDKDTILALMERLANLCSFCPSTDNCVNFFQKEVPTAIDEFLALDPTQTCTEFGLCNENTTLPGLLMTGLDETVAKDRLVKQMLNKARKVQQNMIRMMMRQDENALCDKCLNAVMNAREMLLDNNTQHEVMNFLYPICSYMPPNYQANCEEFVEGVPFMMEMIANEVLLDSTCEEIGLCRNATVEVDTVDTLPDILSRLGFPDMTAGMERYIPGYGRPQQPNRNPYEQPGRNQYEQPSRKPGREQFGVHNPEFPRGNRPQRPYKPRPSKPTRAPKPSLNLDNIFGKNPGGIFDSLPDIPDITVPGFGRITFGNNNKRYQRSLKEGKKQFGFDFDKIMPKKTVPMEKIVEYVPEPFPEQGITLTPEQNFPGPEDCEICKAAVMAVKAWLNDNSAEIQRMILQVTTPVCVVFPSPMREDCVTDITEFTQTFLKELISSLDQDRICNWVGSCATETDVLPEAPVLPTENAAPEVPTTWPFLP